MTIFGRETEIREILDSSSKVVIVAGDSGCGKSEILREMQLRDADSLAPEPVKARASPDALYQALLESLSAALAEVIHGTTALDRLKSVAERVSNIRGDRLGPFILNQLLGLVRTRVSGEAAEALSFVIEQVQNTDAELLSIRLADASENDVVDVVIQFGQEVMSLAGNRKLHLAIDDADKLDESDLRRLQDLSTLLPEGFCLRLAFSIWNQTNRDQVRTLQIAGAELVPLGGLDVGAVQDWLTSRNLDPAWAQDIIKVTNGSAMYVSSAIDLLEGQSSTAMLAALAPPRILGLQTEQSWQSLDNVTRLAAAKLCVIKDPLVANEVAELLDVEPGAWSIIQDNLVRAAIFTGFPPWFHELRRRYLVNELLSVEQLDAALEVARRWVDSRLSLEQRVSADYINYSDLLIEQPTLRPADPRFSALVEATTPEIAILASLIELEQIPDQPFAADAVLLYARQTFGTHGDLVEALDRLSDRGLVTTTGNKDVTIVTSNVSDAELVNFISGRAGSELRRVPVARIANLLFEKALKSELGEYQTATYAIGYESIADMSRRALAIQKSQGGHLLSSSVVGPNLLARLNYGDLPITVTATYANEEQRGEAVSRLSGYDRSIGPQNLVSDVVLSHPLPRVPVLRYVRAAELATGLSLVNPSYGMGSVPKANGLSTLDEEMEARSQVIATLRRLSSVEEELAYGIERPVGYVFRGSPTESLRVQIIGRGGAFRVDALPAALSERPLRRLEIAELANLGDGEFIGPVSEYWGRSSDEPSLSELSDRIKRAIAFNESQARAEVLFDELKVNEALTQFSGVIVSDAERFKSELKFYLDDSIIANPQTNSDIYISVEWDPGEFPMQAFSNLTALRIRTKQPFDVSKKHFRILEPGTSPALNSFGNLDEYKAALAELFEIEPSDIVTIGSGVASSVLCSALGFRTDDIRWRFA